MTLIDFHCHLTESGGYAALEPDRPLFGGIERRVIAVTNRPSDWFAMVKGETRDVTWALGLHPALEHNAKAVNDFRRAVPDAEAIGEVGLDYTRHAASSPQHQRALLTSVLETNEVSGMLVSLHSRGATRDIVAALEGSRMPGAILHWFLGSESEIERAIDIDAFFSINEAMLQSPKGRRVVDLLPPNRVLFETDAPYGGRRGRLCRPGELAQALAALASVWARDADSTRSLIESNQQALLRRLRRVPGPLRGIE